MNNQEYDLIVRIVDDQKYASDEDLKNEIPHTTFNKAIDLRTGSFLSLDGDKKYHIRFEKKRKYTNSNLLLMFKYLRKKFKFERGKLYKVKVRMNNELSDSRADYFDLVSVLGVDVKDDRLDPLADFENEFDSDVFEYKIFIKDKSAGQYNSNGLRVFVYDFDDYKDENGILVHGKFFLDTINRNNNIEIGKVYNILVRKHHEKSHVFLFVKNNGLCKDQELLAAKEENDAVVEIDNELGRFVLNKQSYYYVTDLFLEGKNVNVILSVDEKDYKNVDLQMNCLKKIVKDYPSFIKDLRIYVLDEFDKMQQTKPDPDYNRDKLGYQLNNVSIFINQSGVVNMYFENIDMYGGHSIEVDIELDGTRSTPYFFG